MISVKVYDDEGTEVAVFFVNNWGKFVGPTGTLSKESLGGYILNAVGDPSTKPQIRAKEEIKKAEFEDNKE